MFSRISRLVSAFFNRFLNFAENPTLILEQNIRELQKQIPKLNESVAKSHGSVIMLQKQLGTHIEDSSALENKVKAALQMGEEATAEDLVMELQSIKEKEEKISNDLELAQQNLQQTSELRDMKVTEIKQKIKEIKGAIEEHRFSEMQRSIAEATDSAASMDIESVSNSTDRMLSKMKEATALNQGVFAASLTNSASDRKAMKIEEGAKRLQAKEALSKYKEQLGLEGTTVDAKSNK